MFKDTHVRALIKDSLKDLTLKPKLTLLYFTGPIRNTIERQSLPLISATLLDGLTSDKSNFNWQAYVFWYAFISLAMLLILFVNRYAWHKLDEHITTERFPRYIQQVFTFPYELIANKPRGQIMQKLREKVQFSQGFNIALHDIARISINLVVTFTIIFSRNRAFAFAYLVFWALSSVALYYTAKSRIEINKVANAAFDEYMGKLSDLVGNLETTMQFGNHKNESNKIYRQGKELWAKFTLRWEAARKNQNTISAIQILMNILLVIFGIWSVANGSITIGTFVLLQSYINYAIGDIVAMNDLSRTFVENTTRAIALDEMSEEYPALPEPSKPEKPKSKDMSIEFKNVNFSYSDNKDTALENFSLHIQKGEKIGIVGKSGAGKSTLTKLLLRVYLPSSGEVLIGGKTTRELGSENTRLAIAYVPQDPILFHRSIKENISYAKPNASSKEIEKVAKQAHCMEFVEKIPEGLDALVGDKGVKLSGGQRQRVAIARAILKDSPILIFDEATSALDSESEAIIQEALINVMKNKTSIVIAHRLSTLKHMDRIVVIDQGRVAESGSHAELIKMNGLYTKLWEKQSSGFLSV